MENKKFNEITTVDDKNSNDSKDLINPEADEMIENILAVKGDDEKQDNRIKFYLYRMFDVKAPIAAKLSGYAESYGYALDYKYKKDTKMQHTLGQFIDAMPQHYKTVCKARLGIVAEVEGNALAEYRDNPELAIRHPALLKQVKQGAGVLKDDEPLLSPTVNIKNIQNILLQVHEGPKAIDVTPED